MPKRRKTRPTPHLLTNWEIIDIHFERIQSSGHPNFQKAMELYKISFPLHEQRKQASQLAIMKQDEYHFNLIFEGSEFLGELLCWETDSFIYVEHFCILPEMRNRKYGQKALELLGESGKTVILEIDPPIDEISIHRKAFYVRSGYQANDYAHVHPPYREGFGGHKLVVMSCPAHLSAVEYDIFYRYLRNTVMALETSI